MQTDYDQRPAFFMGGIAVGIIACALLALLTGLSPQEQIGRDYCTKFTPLFVLNEDRTWECIDYPTNNIEWPEGY